MTDAPHNPNPHDEPPDWEALARFLTGESSAAEAEDVQRWLDADPARAALVTTLDRSLERLAFRAPPDLDVEAALHRVRTRVHEPRVDPLRPRPAPPPPAVRRWTMPALRAAAVVVLLLTGAVLVRLALRTPDLRPPVLVAQSFVTAVGEQDSLRLADGSRVVLGPDSRLSVMAGYGDERREVELSGEAFFEVPHDDSRPFTVRAGAAIVRDLGTAFAVTTAVEEGVRVVVTSGAVVLHAVATAADDGVVLRQGDRGVLRPDGRALAQPAAASDDDLAWLSGRLVFEDAPLTEVATALRRWYGIELQVADPVLARRRLSAAFGGEPVERVLEVIALAVGAEFELRGDVATLQTLP